MNLLLIALLHWTVSRVKSSPDSTSTSFPQWDAAGIGKKSGRTWTALAGSSSSSPGRRLGRRCPGKPHQEFQLQHRQLCVFSFSHGYWVPESPADLQINIWGALWGNSCWTGSYKLRTVDLWRSKYKKKKWNGFEISKNTTTLNLKQVIVFSVALLNTDGHLSKDG